MLRLAYGDQYNEAPAMSVTTCLNARNEDGIERVDTTGLRCKCFETPGCVEEEGDT